MNQTEFIREYVINNADNIENGNVSIKDGIFYHYWTPMIERYNDLFILNVSKYSDVTRFLQRKIKSVIPQNMIIEVKGVSEGYKGRLRDFLK